jgi:hypothetical protein
MVYPADELDEPQSDPEPDLSGLLQVSFQLMDRSAYKELARRRKHGLHSGKHDVPCAVMPATRDSRSTGDARPSTPGFLPRISGERRHSRGLAMSFAATSASCARKDWKLRRGDSGRTTPNPGRSWDRPRSSAIR